jgi:hypothetical protein
MKYGNKKMQKMPGGGRLYDYMQAGGKLKMVKNDKGEMVPFYAADGKGQMKDGGKMRGYKMGKKGMKVAGDKPDVGNRKPGQVFVDDGQFYQVSAKGTNSMRMTPGQVFRYLDENSALSAPTEGKTASQSRSFARRGIAEAVAKNDMDLLADYVKPGYKGIEGFAVRAAADKGVGPTPFNPSKRSLRTR